MPRGGKREGAGRQRGKGNKATRARVAAAEASGIMPADVLLFVMRERFAAKDYIAAAQVAKDAAPYYHSKRTAVTISGDASAPLVVEFDGGWYRLPGPEPESPAAPPTDGAPAAGAALPGPV